MYYKFFYFTCDKISHYEIICCISNCDLYNYIMRLKELREMNRKTQIEIANFLDIKQNTYSQYENEQRQISIPLLIKLAQFYNVSVDYILGLTDIDIPYPKQ